MSTILSHPAIPLAIGLGLGARIVPPRLLAAGIAGSMVPDLDVYFPTDHPLLEHRGITHSFVFAVFCGLLAGVFAHRLRAAPFVAFVFVAISTASHGFIDAWTTGGAGILLLWPYSDARYFMPLQFILVPPLGIGPFFSTYGLHVLWSELKWIWLPAVVLGIGVHWTKSAFVALRRRNRA